MRVSVIEHLDARVQLAAPKPSPTVAGRLAAAVAAGDEAYEPAPPNIGSGSRWYVVHTRPHDERRAAEHLARQGFQTFFPCVRKTVSHARKRTETYAALFPNYLFLALDLETDQWRCVNGTCGVVRLILNGDRPAAVPRGVVEVLQHRMMSDGAIDWTQSLKIGDRIQIMDGPFSSFIGTLEQLDPSGRVRVLLSFLGRPVCVALRGAAVMPA